MRITRIVPFVGVLAFSAAAHAAVPPAAKFEGTFTSTIPKAQAEAQMKAEIHDTVDSLNFIIRPFARRRLKEATKQCAALTFDIRGTQLSIRCDDHPAAVSALSGKQGVYENEEQHKFALVQKAQGREIVQVFADRDGKRTNRYLLSPDGRTLKVESTVESDRLKEPLKYTRMFEKNG
jgi:hypothetical protein